VWLVSANECFEYYVVNEMWKSKKKKKKNNNNR